MGVRGGPRSSLREEAKEEEKDKKPFPKKEEKEPQCGGGQQPSKSRRSRVSIKATPRPSQRPREIHQHS